MLSSMELEEMDAVILAGGRGRRFREKGGRDKLYVEIDGKPAILKLIESLEGKFSRIIVTAKKSRVEELEDLLSGKENVLIVPDEVEEYTPLAGMLAGAKASESEFLFIASADTPFVGPELPVGILAINQENIASLPEASLPLWPDGRVEPLLSIYSKNGLLRFEKALNIKPMRATDPARSCFSISLVPIVSLLKKGVSLREFLNINEPSDLTSEIVLPSESMTESPKMLKREEDHPYWSAIEQLEEGNRPMAAALFAEEALELSLASKILALHALLDSALYARELFHSNA
jgi:molybdopterin-guanine dinucleotide biosynthesis protein A